MKKKEKKITEEQCLRALQIWSILVYSAAKGRLISYGDLCKGIGDSGENRPGAKTSHPLELIQQFCKSERGVLRLTSIVGEKYTYLPSSGYEGTDNLARDRKRVFEHPWHDVHQKFSDWVKRRVK